MFPISGMYPPNLLPDEIEHEGEDRLRALVVDSANPVLTGANTEAYERSFAKLELLVVVDVAMTETARLAHYVLPAASQFEKWECTGFNLEFPENSFHLRHPLFPPRGESLPEAEIYTRLLVAMGEIPDRFPVLAQVARRETRHTKHAVYLAALGAALAAKPKWRPYAASIVYRTLGEALETPRARSGRVSPAAAAPLLALAIELAAKEPAAVRAAGHTGNRVTLGLNLFRAILDGAAGTSITKHRYEDTWSFVKHADGKVHLDVPEMLAALRALSKEEHAAHPMVLLAGERRSYNANQIYRDPRWRRVDKEGAMRMHPNDASALGLSDGSRAICRSDRGEIEVVIELDEALRTGMVTLPHGYGMRYRDGAPDGPQLNRLTSSEHCDPLAKTPFHKYVPVSIRAA